MKSIQRKDFIIAGIVEKVHGTKGEIRLNFEQKIQLKEWVFLEIQEKPVPFFIEHISDSIYQPIIKLQGINIPDQAERFINTNVLMPSKGTKRKTRAVDLDVIGYLLIDEEHGEIGTVKALEELPQQLLIVTLYKDNELLIPAVEALIKDIDDKKKIIYLNLPEGMLEL
jgi:16S rRNA processing protein RimM